MTGKFQFNRNEIAGSLGDLGTILPIAIGMILVNGLSSTGLFFSVGLFYILTGIYFGITVPVQPMKVIGAYSIATMMTADQVLASGLLMAILLMVIGLTGTMDIIGRNTPKSVIRGVQLSTGSLLMAQGVKLMIGNSNIQDLYGMAEPYLKLQRVGAVPVGIIIGIIGIVITFYFIENRKVPAAIVVVLTGLIIGIVLSDFKFLSKMQIGLYFPHWMPFGFPLKIDFTFAIFALVLPQIPMTFGNAVIANADLSNTYFGDASNKMTYKSLCISMGIGNLISFLFGGMPLCHGAGGLSAHYRFGARTAGSNLFIGFLFIGLVLLLGNSIITFFGLIPLSTLGVLLFFAGSQLSMTLLDVSKRMDLFVVVSMLSITLASNLAYAFGVGLAMAYLLKFKRFNI